MRWSLRRRPEPEKRDPSHVLVAELVKAYRARSPSRPPEVAEDGRTLDVLRTELGLTALPLEEFAQAWRSLAPADRLRILRANFGNVVPFATGDDPAYRKLTGRDDDSPEGEARL